MRRLHGALINGRRVNSCLTLAVAHEGEEITTIEGLAKGDQLHPMQAAFVEHDGFQCGYCTPGQICSAVACVQEGHADRGRSDPRMDERQSLPLRRVSEHRRRDQTKPRGPNGSEWRNVMNPFTYSAPRMRETAAIAASRPIRRQNFSAAAPIWSTS